jgi:hypothetical protein
MKTKFTKKELREELQILINTVNFDSNNTDETLVSNEVWSETDNDWIQLDRASRVILLDKKIDENHLIRRLIEILDRV